MDYFSCFFLSCVFVFKKSFEYLIAFRYASRLVTYDLMKDSFGILYHGLEYFVDALGLMHIHVHQSRSQVRENRFKSRLGSSIGQTIQTNLIGSKDFRDQF